MHAARRRSRQQGLVTDSRLSPLWGNWTEVSRPATEPRLRRPTLAAVRGAGGKPGVERDRAKPRVLPGQQRLARHVGAEGAAPGRDQPDVLPAGGEGAP